MPFEIRRYKFPPELRAGDNHLGDHLEVLGMLHDVAPRLDDETPPLDAYADQLEAIRQRPATTLIAIDSMRRLLGASCHSVNPVTRTAEMHMLRVASDTHPDSWADIVHRLLASAEDIALMQGATRVAARVTPELHGFYSTSDYQPNESGHQHHNGEPQVVFKTLPELLYRQPASVIESVRR